MDDRCCHIIIPLKNGLRSTFDVCVLNHSNEQLYYYGAMTLEDYAFYPNAFLDNIPKDMYMIDVGAHIGASSFAVAKLGYKVYAFEPLFLNRRAFQTGLEWNKLKDLITLYPYALGNKSEDNITIYIPKERFDNASLNSICSNMNVKKEALLTENISLTSIDEWNKDKGLGKELNGKTLDPKLCRIFKIDVQGFEYEVIEGAKEFLKEAVKNSLFILEFEWDPHFMKTRDISKEKMYSLLSEIGLNKFSIQVEKWDLNGSQNIQVTV